MTDKKEYVLTDMQKAFLDALQDPEAGYDPRKAANIAGYSKKTPLFQIIKPIAKEVQKIADSYMSINTLKAANAIIEGIDNPTELGLPNKLKAAESLLDRVGLSKRLREEEVGTQMRAVILLPPKLDD